jgi:chromosome segregation ATPase
MFSEKSQLVKFEAEKEEQIRTIKNQNRSILEKEMGEINRNYTAVKYDLQEVERRLNAIIDSNSRVEDENKRAKSNFETEKQNQLKDVETEILKIQGETKAIEIKLTEREKALSQLVEPAPETLPEQFVISEQLEAAHLEFEALKVEVNKAEGVNENNAKMKAEREIEIKEKQSNLLQIIQEINDLQTAISDYFSNLSEIVKTEFSGQIEIDVELLEYVMSRDEYKDCFKITANGKIFPYECNGALQNNVKMQILYNLQRLRGYKGVTIMDNCEANTTQPINILGLSAVIAFATLENELIIR